MSALRHRGGDVRDSGLHTIEEQLGELQRQVRELSLSLRPTMLDDHGLVPALRWLFQRLGEQTGLAVTFEPQDDCADMPAEAQLTAYRIVQEALTNVLRHAGVDEAAVRLEADAEAWRVEIVDRGSGFDSDAARVGASCGIDGMHERADLLGGILEVESVAGSGTRVALSLPRDS